MDKNSLCNRRNNKRKCHFKTSSEYSPHNEKINSCLQIRTTICNRELCTTIYYVGLDCSWIDIWEDCIYE
jgi:hypothetical protein